jgi:hypothetical protein
LERERHFRGMQDAPRYTLAATAIAAATPKHFLLAPLLLVSCGGRIRHQLKDKAIRAAGRDRAGHVRRSDRVIGDHLLVDFDTKARLGRG